MALYGSIDDVDVKAISKSISDTAVDIFIYDTRKDSDGGAWRKRTQHTSWYNETLNTSTRGSRREFPAVAVIVAETSKITIYDGDDPDLPMWMVFSANGIIDWATSQQTRLAVSALNGKMTNVGGDGGNVFSFIEDYVYIIYASANYPIMSSRTIEGRNDTTSYITATGQAINVYVVLTHAMNDVAMTVLPNAPIDAATGLPVPTIAVATNGGISVIHDDGTVTSRATSSSVFYTTQIAFGTSDDYWYQQGYFTDIRHDGRTMHVSSGNLRSTAAVQGYSGKESFEQEYSDFYFNRGVVKLLGVAGDTTTGTEHLINDTAGSKRGLTFINNTDVGLYNDAVAYTTSNYATGWLHGDIKLATLSDTDDTNVTGSELVTNGTFDSNISGWSDASTGTGSIAYDNGTLKFIGADYPNNVGEATQTISVVSGETYTVTFEVTSARGLYHQATGGWSKSANYTTGIHSYTVTAATNSAVLRFEPIGGSVSDFGNVDNISVRLAEEDRSVNGNGLQVFGTVTKTAVATGADLVSYRGNGYLDLPSVGNLVLTNDFSIAWWQKHNGGGIYEGWQIAGANTTGAYDQVVISAMHEVSTGQYLIRGNSITGSQVTNGIASGSWTCLTLTKQGSTIKLYTNGKLSSTTTGTTPTPSYAYSLQLLRWQYGSALYATGNSELALFRISGTVPSPEQIKKIYEDEKHLFQENAKATLYGSSDAVTALAYDDDTELLHAGTSAGRSVFQGLRRIDNTTDAVGAAISASNGMVAED